MFRIPIGLIDVPTADSVVDPNPPAVQAFDAIASSFDERFGAWASVAAQRRAVRRALLRAVPRGASLLELGGGTGEDALFLAAHGRRVLMTDGAPTMLACAKRKAAAAGLSHRVRTRRVLLEQLDELAANSPRFDGVFSNFAALNCVTDLGAVARGLAPLLAPGSAALLVMFGPFAPGEVVVQLLRRDLRAAVRRLSGSAVPARLAGRSFTVRYPSPRAVARAFSPWFELVRTLGIGVFVPPSAAEPAISRFPRVLAALEVMDRVAASPLAWLGDHVLLEFRRTAVHNGGRGDGRRKVGDGHGGSEAGEGGCWGIEADEQGCATRRGRRPTVRCRRRDEAGTGSGDRARRFRDAYARHRAVEGRTASADELLALPFVREGGLARQWGVRARTYLCFAKRVLAARAAEVAPRPLRVLDLGAGNGWLCYRVARHGHAGLAVDIRTDAVDGLGAADGYAGCLSPMFPRIAAPFEALPLADDSSDIAVFNASLHYALDLQHALAEAERVVMPGGRIAILDSPFYARAADGDAMVEEKVRRAPDQFGGLAQDLMALPFVEFLTRARLESASSSLGLVWRRHRVRYPLAYEARPVLAWLRGRRIPSRFDLWEAVVT